ncbi:MAG: hypothetical protein JJU15_02240 [Pararhodobacter sp.]|nr:hypothetical protein [Pararhodobacter sp.]
MHLSEIGHGDGRDNGIAALAPEGGIKLDRLPIKPLPLGRVQANARYTPYVDALIIGDLVLSWTHVTV